MSQQLQGAKGLKKYSLPFDNALLRSLPVDPKKENGVREVKACFSLVSPDPLLNPRIVASSRSALKLLGLEKEEVDSDPYYAELFSGNFLFEGSQPNAHCYCGHQFGGFAGQLGDGRAISLGEVVNEQKQRWEVQLKGAGKTPFSRFADGRAVLRSSIREYLCSEHMAALNVPTTRAATLVVSDTVAVRDPLYNGNQILEKCAIVSRLSPNFLRFGSWEVFVTSQGRSGPLIDQPEISNQMLDHVIKYFFPEIEKKYEEEEGGKEKKYEDFFKQVVVSTAQMVAEWQLVGFTHGVLNTDNMSILGVTIDYGPFGFLDRFNPKFTPNTTDESGRYCFQAQPAICRWNLQKFAQGLSHSIPLETSLKIIDQNYNAAFKARYVEKFRKKLGLAKSLEKDEELFSSFFLTLRETVGDFTNSFRALNQVEMESPRSGAFPQETFDLLVKNSGSVRDLQRISRPPFNQAQLDSLKLLQKESPQTFLAMTGGDPNVIEFAENALKNYEKMQDLTDEEKKEKDRELWKLWLDKYTERLEEEVKELGKEEKKETEERRKKMMKENNPKFILRNYLLQRAIKEAEEGRFEEFQRLEKVMLDPFEEHPGNDDLGVDGNVPDWACNFVLSCSS